MSKATVTLLALATLSATGTLAAQNAYLAGPGNISTNATSSYAAPAPENFTQDAAPIERTMQPDFEGVQQPNGGDPGLAPRHTTESQPAQGVWLRSASGSSVDTVGTGNGHVELRVDHGRANITVDHPEHGSEILVDLPGGQISLVKDGVYTFNAETNTVRVLQGEAEAFPGDKGKAVKVKEDHELVLGADAKAHEVDRNELRADLLAGETPRGYGYGGARPGYGGYGYGPYGDGFAYGGGYGYGGYPYGYGFGAPYYAFGYPYGYGFGLGFGYYGGFGGFRGGYGGFGGRGFGGFRR